MSPRDALDKLFSLKEDGRKVKITVSNGDEYFGYPKRYIEEIVDEDDDGNEVLVPGFYFQVNDNVPEMSFIKEKGYDGYGLTFASMSKIEPV